MVSSNEFLARLASSNATGYFFGSIHFNDVRLQYESLKSLNSTRLEIAGPLPQERDGGMQPLRSYARVRCVVNVNPRERHAHICSSGCRNCLKDLWQLQCGKRL